jgi:hypothetical protein
MLSSSTLKTRPLALLAAAIALLVLQSASAAPIHNLVITENSSTSLTVTYDGSTTGVDVNYISGDHWGVTVGFPVTFSGNPQWTEPEDPSFFNVLTLSGVNQFIVNSDFFSNGTTPLADGATLPNFGTDARNGAPISITFNDHGDVAAVPDAGSTSLLLLLSLAVLFGAARFRSHRLA